MTSLWNPRFFRLSHDFLGCTHTALYEHDTMQEIHGVSWLTLTNPANKSIPSLSLFLSFFNYSFVDSFSLSFLLPSFCLIYCGVPHFYSPTFLSVNNWISYFLESPHTTLACLLAFSSQLVKLWSPWTLFWWTSSEGFVSMPGCPCWRHFHKDYRLSWQRIGEASCTVCLLRRSERATQPTYNDHHILVSFWTQHTCLKSSLPSSFLFCLPVNDFHQISILVFLCLPFYFSSSVPA